VLWRRLYRVLGATQAAGVTAHLAAVANATTPAEATYLNLTTTNSS